MFDTTDDDSNRESVTEGSELNVNAAASTMKPKRRKEKKLYKSTEMPAAVVAKMMANRQYEVRDPITKELVSYVTYASKMAVTDYTRFDSMMTDDVAEPLTHFNANLSHAHGVEYVANLSKRDRVVGGVHLALADGGANSLIIGQDMRIMYFNSDGKRVSIGIAGDHELTGNRLCCGCSVAKVMDGSSCTGLKERK